MTGTEETIEQLKARIRNLEKKLAKYEGRPNKEQVGEYIDISKKLKLWEEKVQWLERWGIFDEDSNSFIITEDSHFPISKGKEIIQDDLFKTKNTKSKED